MIRVIRHTYRLMVAQWHRATVWQEYPTVELVAEIRRSGEQAAHRELQRRYGRLTYTLLRSAVTNPNVDNLYTETCQRALYSSGSPEHFTVRLWEGLEERVVERRPLCLTFFRRHFIYGAGYDSARFLEAFDDAWQPGMTPDQVLDGVSRRLLLDKDYVGERVAIATVKIRRSLVQLGDSTVRKQTGGRFGIDNLFLMPYA